METRNAVELLIQEGYLPSPDLLHDESFNASHFLTSLRQKVVSRDKPVVVHKDFFTLFTRNKPLDLNWVEFEKSRAVFEKGKNPHIYQTFLSYVDVPRSFSQFQPTVSVSAHRNSRLELRKRSRYIYIRKKSLVNMWIFSFLKNCS